MRISVIPQRFGVYRLYTHECIYNLYTLKHCGISNSYMHTQYKAQGRKAVYVSYHALKGPWLLSFPLPCLDEHFLVGVYGWLLAQLHGMSSIAPRCFCLRADDFVCSCPDLHVCSKCRAECTRCTSYHIISYHNIHIISWVYHVPQHTRASLSNAAL